MASRASSCDHYCAGLLTRVWQGITQRCKVLDSRLGCQSTEMDCAEKVSLRGSGLGVC